MVTCPECDADIDIDRHDVDEGDTISCESCGTEFEVTGVDPLELEPVDDDDDEEDEEFDEEDDDEGEDDVDDEEDNWGEE
ncbi:MAG: hypothetical protein GEU99_15495 [Luteitalea sp.]|nr:hypothetical protein [Luteitalea sp.]